MKKLYYGCLLASLFLCLSSAGALAPRSNGGLSGQIVILVFSTASGQDQLDITYPGVVSHATAQHDLSVLQSMTHWTIGNTKITDDKPPVKGATDKMTSVEFTASTAVQSKDHGLPVEPFIQTFRAYKAVSLTYIVGGNFQFQGLRQYADNHVQINLDQHGSAYTYHIQIIDPKFQRLNLPLSQPAVSDIHWINHQNNSSHTQKKISSWLMVIVALAAVTIGGFVYVAMSRHS